MSERFPRRNRVSGVEEMKTGNSKCDVSIRRIKYSVYLTVGTATALFGVVIRLWAGRCGVRFLEGVRNLSA